MTLKRGRLKVTHGDVAIDVTRYHRAPLPDVANDAGGDATAPTADRDELERRTRAILRRGLLGEPKGTMRPRRVSVAGRTEFERCPQVRAWVLELAGGRCELCSEAAPFVDEAGMPFLEVHHVLQLAHNGPDVVKNAVAVCPNCHRRLHHASDRDLQRERLYLSIPRLRRPIAR